MNNTRKKKKKNGPGVKSSKLEFHAGKHKEMDYLSKKSTRLRGRS
jgi:hypothetical protein